jgi:hypothetical protein
MAPEATESVSEASSAQRLRRNACCAPELPARIEEYRSVKAQYGHRWFSLWTGGLGLAIQLLPVHHRAIELRYDRFPLVGLTLVRAN